MANTVSRPLPRGGTTVVPESSEMHFPRDLGKKGRVLFNSCVLCMAQTYSHLDHPEATVDKGEPQPDSSGIWFVFKACKFQGTVKTAYGSLLTHSTE